MSRKSIGGVLQYERLAQRHRPLDRDALARECVRLAAMGLRARDIASALRVDLGDVLQWLRLSGSLPPESTTAAARREERANSDPLGSAVRNDSGNNDQ